MGVNQTIIIATVKCTMPGFNPITRNNVIGRLHGGQSPDNSTFTRAQFSAFGRD
jgi:hypothetical protein